MNCYHIAFHFRTELEELELKVREERERYEESTHGNPNSLTMIQPFSINDRFVLDRETSCYLLAIELVIPIEYVVLQVCELCLTNLNNKKNIQSDADVELMDIARSTAVVSFTKPPQDGVSHLSLFCNIRIISIYIEHL